MELPCFVRLLAFNRLLAFKESLIESSWLQIGVCQCRSPSNTPQRCWQPLCCPILMTCPVTSCLRRVDFHSGEMKMRQHVGPMLARSLFFLVTALLVPAFTGWFMPTAEAATPLYSNGFEDAADIVSPRVARHGGCYAYSFALDTGIRRSGNSSTRIINKGLENNQNCTNWVQGPKHRAEFHFRDEGFPNRFEPFNLNGKVYWIGWSVFVPNSYPTGRRDGVITGQIVAHPGPETKFLIRGSKWIIERAWDDGAGNSGRVAELSTPVTRGTWTDWILYFERSWDPDGVMKVWQNGTLILDVTGRNANYNLAFGGSHPYFKAGIYWGADDRNAEYTLYFDNVRIAEGLDGYDLVNPAGSGPPFPLIPTGLGLSVQ